MHLSDAKKGAVTTTQLYSFQRGNVILHFWSALEEETSIPNETPCVAGVCLYRKLSTVHIPGKKETHHEELFNSQEDHK